MHRYSILGKNLRWNIISNFSPLACTCNSIGSTKSDDTACDNKCCDNDGSCKCSEGYSGDDCNICDTNYYVSATDNEENTCTGNITNS